MSLDEFQPSCSQDLLLLQLIKTNFDVKKYARMEFSIGTGRTGEYLPGADAIDANHSRTRLGQTAVLNGFGSFR